MSSSKHMQHQRSVDQALRTALVARVAPHLPKHQEHIMVSLSHLLLK